MLAPLRAVAGVRLTHASVLGPPMAEIARVLRPGGEAILSDVHPVIAATGGMAFYRTTAGEQRFVRNHVHWASAYLDAFASAGLHVGACYEPRLGEATGVRHFMSNPSPSEEAIAWVAFQGLPGACVDQSTKAVSARDPARRLPRRRLAHSASAGLEHADAGISSSVDAGRLDVWELALDPAWAQFDN